MRHQFTVTVDNRPDALADLFEALAAHDVDLRAIGVGVTGQKTAAVLMTSDDAATHEALRAERQKFREGEVVITSVPDQPGALAHLIRYLAEADIKLQGLLLLRWHQGKA